MPFTDVENLNDVGMLKAGDGLGLGSEAGTVFLVGELAAQEHLQRHDTLELRVPRPIDNAHAAAAQLAQDLIRPDLGGQRRWFGRRYGLGVQPRQAPQGSDNGVGHAVQRLHGRLAPRTLLQVFGDFLQCFPGQPPQVEGGELSVGRASGKRHG